MRVSRTRVLWTPRESLSGPVPEHRIPYPQLQLRATSGRRRTSEVASPSSSATLITDNEDTNPGKRWLDRMLEHLKPLVIQNQVSAWSDMENETGEHWNASILSQLETAKVAILLISPAFLASEYIRNSELPVLLLKAKSKGVTVMPIIVRHSMFSETKFKYPDPVKGPEEMSLSVFQSANPPSKPLNAMEEHEQDRVLLSIAQRILRMVQRTP